jgi:hypothetical protein
MILITKAPTEHLLPKGRAERAAMDKGDNARDFRPVVKFFTPDAQCTWLLTHLPRTPSANTRRIGRPLHAYSYHYNDWASLISLRLS